MSKARGRRRRKKRSYPKGKFIVFTNPIKTFHEKWYKGRDLLDFPHPFRMIIAAAPNTGKTGIIKNIIYRSAKGDKSFKKIYLIHGDKTTTEYDDVGGIKKLTRVPDPDKLGSAGVKSLLIIDDFITNAKMDPKDEKRLSTIMSRISTHKNFSIIITSQYITYIPTSIRSLANIHVISKVKNFHLLPSTAHAVGIHPDKFKEINREFLMPNAHSTLWVDGTTNTPKRYRLNGYDDVPLLD